MWTVKQKFKVPEPLWRAKTLGRRLEIATQSYQAVYWRLTSTTAPLDSERVMGSRHGNREDALLIAGEKRDRLRRQYLQAVETANRIIDLIEDERCQDILTNRYITGMTPAESAKTMHYSVDWERELHRKAIEEFKKFM